jgi:murein DD-endopeptidase MepM/ murein hydrolase activator NlpD
VVILKHQDKYSTLYAHMEAFETGIEKGARVKQGESIGFVGMTGLTTGPHLHFEFLIDGVHHDPLSVDMPKALPLAPDVKKAIREIATPHARTMALLRDTRPGAFE